MLMLVFIVVRNFINIPSDGIPYAIFSFSVLVPWTFFTAAINASSTSILSNAQIIKKMGLNREVFPLASVSAAAFSLVMSGVVLAGMIVWYKVPVGWSLLWLPVLVLLTGMLALGIGLFLSALGTFKRDFILANVFLTQIWMYMTPIIYPLSLVTDEWRSVYVINPMVGIIEGFRNVLAIGTSPDLNLLGWSFLSTVVIWGIAWPLFRRMSQHFADAL